MNGVSTSGECGSRKSTETIITRPGIAAEHSAFNSDISLEKLVKILEFCNEPRTRAELQEFCDYKSPSHFREKILAPLLAGGQLVLTINIVMETSGKHFCMLKV